MVNKGCIEFHRDPAETH